MSDIAIEFSRGDLWLVNAAIALMMFGVALGMTPADFRRVRDIPRAPVTGLAAQFLLLPALTTLAVVVLDPAPGVALGMILVACCPGGTYSNVATWLARGSVAVSITMTAISSVAAIVLTPLNFSFWGSLPATTRAVLSEIRVDPVEVVAVIGLVLALPIAAGMLVRSRAPDVADRAERPARLLTLVLFLVIVALAFARNLALFLDILTTVVPIVVGHNAVALALGWGAARSLGLGDADRRAVTLEVGIQNSGLGLALAFTFLAGVPDTILVVALWGVWHLVSGLGLALLWSRRPPAGGADAASASAGAGAPATGSP